MPAAINQVIDIKGLARVESFRQADPVKTVALRGECHVIEKLEVHTFTRTDLKLSQQKWGL